MHREELTSARLRELFIYDPSSGYFYRRKAVSNMKSGDFAGTRGGSGYLQIKVNRKTYQAHRLAWLYIKDQWPDGFIDHIDGRRDNNAFSNLREVDNAGNMQNMKVARVDNKSAGLLGVSRVRSRWRAMISIDGKNRYLGTFSSPEDAHQAYLAAKRKHHPTCTI